MRHFTRKKSDRRNAPVARGRKRRIGKLCALSHPIFFTKASGCDEFWTQRYAVRNRIFGSTPSKAIVI